MINFVRNNGIHPSIGGGFSPAGAGGFIINTFAGNFSAIGINGAFSGDGGVPSQAEFYWTAGCAIDSAGNIYIVDLWNNRVRAVNMQGTTQTICGVSVGAGQIQTIAGSGSGIVNSKGYAGDGGSATSALMAHPCAIALDSSGNVYVADQQNAAIRRIKTSGIIDTVVGGPPTSSTPGTGPVSLALTSVATASGGNTVYTGTFNPIPAATSFLYIQDFTNAANNGRFQVVSANATTATLNNANGVAETKTARAMYACLNFPQGVALDAAGNIYVANSNQNCIGVYNTQGTTQTLLGVGVPAGNFVNVVSNGASTGYSGDSGAATSAALHQPLGVGLDGSGNLYIADAYNNVVRKVTTAGIISTFAGSAATLNISNVSNNTTNSIYTYTLTSGPALNLISIAGIETWVTITGCTTSANNGTFRIIALGAGTFTVANASGVSESESGATGFSGVPNYTGDGGLATSATTCFPFDVKFDSSGNCFIADTGNNLVRKVSGGKISTIAGDFSLYGNNGGYGGDGNTATLAGLGSGAGGSGVQGVIGPVGLIPDTHGNIYVGDTGNNLVRILKPSPVPAPTVASLNVTTGPQGGGTAITITGTGFMLNATVSFGGNAATSVVVVSPTSITCVTPSSGSIGGANVTVTNATGQAGSLNNGFTYFASAQLVSSLSVATHGTGGQTNGSSMNTTGATCLVAVLCGFVAQATMSDGKSNTWNYLTGFVNSNTNIRIAYAFGVTVGSGHTFTVGGADASAVIYAVSGTKTDATVFDTSTGANGPLSSPFQPGSLTPTLGDFVLTGFANDVATTTASIAGAGSDTAWSTPVVVPTESTDEDGGASILLYASGSALNPTWTTSQGSNSAAIACFKKA